MMVDEQLPGSEHLPMILMLWEMWPDIPNREVFSWPERTNELRFTKYRLPALTYRLPAIPAEEEIQDD